MKRAILVVEDSVESTLVIKKYLTEAKYSDIECLENREFDAILIDINLNDNEDGITLASTIDEDFNLPYLFVTGQNSRSIIESIAELKYQRYIPKPIQKENLITNLAILLKSHSKLIKIAQEFNYDTIEKKVFRDDTLVKLSKNETKLLDILAKRINHYVTRDDISFHIWQDNPPKATNALRELKRCLLAKLDN